MKPGILLRSASVIMLLHALGHTMGTLGWKKTTDPFKQSIIHQMTDNKFPFMGANKSFGDAMDGYGYSGIISLCLLAVLLWMASNYLELKTNLVRHILILLAMVLLGQSIVEFIYFFPLAGGMTLVSALLVIIAILKTSRPIQ